MDTQKTLDTHKHNCPVLGENTNVIMAMTADSTGEYILYRQQRCPMCNYTTGEKILAPGIKEYNGGYLVNTFLAEQLTKGSKV